MSKSARFIILGALVLAAVFAVVVTQRLDYPKKSPWWSGRNPVVRIQVWEKGKEIPTVSMTLPKRTLDQMVAFGLAPTISVGEGNEVHFGKVWHDLQRLPRGRKLRFEDAEGTVLLWIEPKGEPATPDSVL
jgi:hypothetical protein